MRRKHYLPQHFWIKGPEAVEVAALGSKLSLPLVIEVAVEVQVRSPIKKW